MNALLTRFFGWWEGLEERERTLIGVAGALFLAFLLIFGLVRLAAQKKRLERGVTQVNEQITQTLAMLQEIDEIDAKLKGVELPIGKSCNVNLFTALESILRSCGVENISIRPLTTPQSTYYTEQAVEIEARRILLKTLVGCLYQIDQSPTEYRAWRFQAKKRFDDSNLLDVRFQVSTFCGKEPGGEEEAQ